jgi:hypothetical protein
VEKSTYDADEVSISVQTTQRRWILTAFDGIVFLCPIFTVSHFQSVSNHQSEWRNAASFQRALDSSTADRGVR